MADFVGCLLPLRESAQGSAFRIVQRTARALEELRRSTRPAEWTALSIARRVQGGVEVRFPKGTSLYNHLEVDFSLFGGLDGEPEKRSLTLWFDYNDGAATPNLYILTGRWGRYEQIFGALEREFLDLLDLAQPVLLDGRPKT